MLKLKTLLQTAALLTYGFAANAAGSSPSSSPNLGDDSCDSLLLVSSWAKNNVNIYDGCSGEFIRDLDSQNLIDGPLGILEAPDGDLLVVSENNSRLLKFDRETLSKGTVIMGDDPATRKVEETFISNPSGAVIDDKGFMYASSYSRNSVVKINTHAWRIMHEVLPADNGLIEGIDAGMALSDDGHLFIPGYDSDNIIKLHLRSRTATTLVPSGTAGLDGPRTIVLRDGQLTVTAERSHAIMAFDPNSGEFIETLVQIGGPTGMVQDGPDHFLVNNYQSVFRITNDISDFTRPIASGAGGLAGGTFIYRLQKH